MKTKENRASERERETTIKWSDSNHDDDDTNNNNAMRVIRSYILSFNVSAY